MLNKSLKMNVELTRSGNKHHVYYHPGKYVYVVCSSSNNNRFATMENRRCSLAGILKWFKSGPQQLWLGIESKALGRCT